VAAFVIELLCCGGDFFVDEGVAGEVDSGSVDSGIVAWSESPYYGGSCHLHRIDDDFGDGLAFLFCQQHHFFKQVLRVVALDERDDEGGVGPGKEVADGDAGALALMRVLPELPVVCGDIEGRQDLPVVLFDRRSQ